MSGSFLCWHLFLCPRNHYNDNNTEKSMCSSRKSSQEKLSNKVKYQTKWIIWEVTYTDDNITTKPRTSRARWSCPAAILKKEFHLTTSERNSIWKLGRILFFYMPQTLSSACVRILSLIWFPSLFVSTKMPNNAMTSLTVPSSQRHTLPIWECMHSISEVIILNNDQQQHQKIISTNNRINWRIRRQHTTVVNWFYCLR